MTSVRKELLCNNMCIFDWAGNLLGNIKLSIEVIDIYYDSITKKMNLIGINPRGEYQIFTINEDVIYDAVKTINEFATCEQPFRLDFRIFIIYLLHRFICTCVIYEKLLDTALHWTCDNRLFYSKPARC